MKVIRQDVVSPAPEDVELAVERDHRVAVPPVRRERSASQDMLRRDPRPGVTRKVVLEEGVGDLCARLAGEDEHGVVRDGHGEVAARRRGLAGVLDLLPDPRLSVVQTDLPHVVQSSVSVIP